MAKGKNCPNCGAVIDPEQNKCAFCGTSYFDLACIPINEPFYLKLNVGTTENPRIICQKVIMHNVSITHYSNTMNIEYGPNGLISFPNPTYPTYDMSFTGVGPAKETIK